MGDAAILSERCTTVKKELIEVVNEGKGEAALSAALDKARAIPNFNNKVRGGGKGPVLPGNGRQRDLRLGHMPVRTTSRSCTP